MAEYEQLRKLGRLLDEGKNEEAALMIRRMLDMLFSNVGGLYNLVSRYPPLDISPYNISTFKTEFCRVDVAILDNEHISNIVSGNKCFPHIQTYYYGIFDDCYFMGYHTHVRGNIIYDFKINRGYFIVLKFAIDEGYSVKQLIYIGGVKRQFDALYDYCKVIKPNYYLTLNIREEGANIVIDVSYNKWHIIKVVYSDAAGDRLTKAEQQTENTGAQEYPPDDYKLDSVAINASFRSYISDMTTILPYEKTIVVNFNNHVITSYFNPYYSRQEKTNYCHSLIEDASRDY